MSERKTRGSKAATGVFHDTWQLPEVYNLTQITLLARDPFWMHAYWDISQDSLDGIREQLGEEFQQSTYVLRLYDVTAIDFNGSNANHWFDIDVGPNARNWYINIWCDNVAYCAEIGIRSPWGQFFPLGRSNTVVTPRSSMSGRQEMIWMRVAPGRRDSPFVVLEKSPQQKVDALEAIPDARSRKSHRKFYLTEEDIRAYYSKLFPLLKRVRNKRRKPKLLKVKVPAAVRALDGLDEDDSLAAMIKLGFQPESSTIPGLYSNRYKTLLGAGASAELVREGGGSEEIFSGASEREQQLRQRKFFFEIWADLIVYGRTEPDAEVKLGTKVIPLRSDGTFTLRYALPDLRLPFDFTATSNDRVEQRAISTAVERFKTVYNP